jgi:hypothetical protein
MRNEQLPKEDAAETLREEGGEVLADDAVEHGVVRTVGNVVGRRGEGRAHARCFHLRPSLGRLWCGC